MSDTKTLNDYAAECHTANMKWWQDIETAPRDGTKVLLGCFGDVDPGSKKRLGTVAVDYWHTIEEHGFTGWGQFNAEYWPPSHWCEVPTIPAKSQRVIKVGDTVTIRPTRGFFNGVVF